MNGNENSQAMHRVVFVCSANMCRSPMAEVLFKCLLAEQGLSSDWQVSSAGVWAIDGSRASEGAVKTMQSRGYDLRNHRAQSISQDIMDENGLILVMEQNHKEALRAAFPQAAEKIFLLSEMVDKNYDIIDPIGGTRVDYQDTAEELEQLLRAGLVCIQRLCEESEDVNRQ